MTISTEQKEAFWRDGFLPYPQLLSAEELRALQQRTEDIAYGRVNLPADIKGIPILQKEPSIIKGEAKAANPLDELRKINFPSFVDEVFQHTARSPKIVDVIVDLFGTEDIKLLGDQIFMKPPHLGSAKEYHQDTASWPHLVPQSQITCWIAIDAATVDNGCMRCIPASHTLGLIQLQHLPQLLTDEVKATDRAIELPAGGCMFHHSLNLHYTGANTTAYRRRGWALHYMIAQSRDLSAPDEVHVDYISIRGKSYPGCV
ncbi:MAG: phytanoyl-CoA dioxygenase family protein [Chloroflexi bacterium]|nr:phytanoyl-CoA dioxygenase family protein [Chloroflexota bacterium]